jgi:hypothetical protein
MPVIPAMLESLNRKIAVQTSMDINTRLFRKVITAERAGSRAQV